MSQATYKLVVYTPLSHAQAVRKALGDAGAGKIGDYTHCSFAIRGVGRYKAPADGNPFIGQAGEFSEVEEERLEVNVPEALLPAVLRALKTAHPYEEIAYDLYPLTPPPSTF